MASSRGPEWPRSESKIQHGSRVSSSGTTGNMSERTQGKESMTWLERMNARLDSFLDINLDEVDPQSLLFQTTSLVEDSVTSVGSSVRKLCTEFVKELLVPPYPTDDILDSDILNHVHSQSQSHGKAFTHNTVAPAMNTREAPSPLPGSEVASLGKDVPGSGADVGSGVPNKREGVKVRGGTRRKEVVSKRSTSLVAVPYTSECSPSSTDGTSEVRVAPKTSLIAAESCAQQHVPDVSTTATPSNGAAVSTTATPSNAAVEVSAADGNAPYSAQCLSVAFTEPSNPSNGTPTQGQLKANPRTHMPATEAHEPLPSLAIPPAVPDDETAEPSIPDPVEGFTLSPSAATETEHSLNAAAASTGSVLILGEPALLGLPPASPSSAAVSMDAPGEQEGETHGEVSVGMQLSALPGSVSDYSKGTLRVGVAACLSPSPSPSLRGTPQPSLSQPDSGDQIATAPLAVGGGILSDKGIVDPSDGTLKETANTLVQEDETGIGGWSNAGVLIMEEIIASDDSQEEDIPDIHEVEVAGGISLTSGSKKNIELGKVIPPVHALQGNALKMGAGGIVPSKCSPLLFSSKSNRTGGALRERYKQEETRTVVVDGSEWEWELVSP